MQPLCAWLRLALTQCTRCRAMPRSPGGPPRTRQEGLYIDDAMRAPNARTGSPRRRPSRSRGDARGGRMCVRRRAGISGPSRASNSSVGQRLWPPDVQSSIRILRIRQHRIFRLALPLLPHALLAGRGLERAFLLLLRVLGQPGLRWLPGGGAGGLGLRRAALLLALGLALGLLLLPWLLALLLALLLACIGRCLAWGGGHGGLLGAFAEARVAQWAAGVCRTGPRLRAAQGGDAGGAGGVAGGPSRPRQPRHALRRAARGVRAAAHGGLVN